MVGAGPAIAAGEVNPAVAAGCCCRCLPPTAGPKPFTPSLVAVMAADADADAAAAAADADNAAPCRATCMTGSALAGSQVGCSAGTRNKAKYTTPPEFTVNCREASKE